MLYGRPEVHGYIYFCEENPAFDCEQNDLMLDLLNCICLTKSHQMQLREKSLKWSKGMHIVLGLPIFLCCHATSNFRNYLHHDPFLVLLNIRSHTTLWSVQNTKFEPRSTLSINGGSSDFLLKG